jgi:hypothetical protein
MKYIQIKLFLLILILVALGSMVIKPYKASALSGSDFRAGRIIDDAVFYNGSAMSAGEIQNFLNAKVPACDTNGTQPSNRNGYATRADWGRANGYAPPYTCLKDYSENTPTKTADSYCSAYSGGTKSAAQIIRDVGVACNISQKSMIVLLQKEQSLITDDWPWSNQYRSATGYGCPDTAPCDSEYYGFFNQVYNAARQFQRYRIQANLFNYRAGQTRYVQYNPNAGCGGTNVYIENAATAALYNYTPYQPNVSALNNLYGSGDACGAYGNRNFWRLHNDWFGSTIGPNYSWEIESYTYSGGDNVLSVGQSETVTLKARNTGRVPWYNHGNNPVRLATWEPADRISSFFGTNRLATVSENVVLPNEVGTFVFQINPSKKGTFVEGLNLVAENSQFMQWTGLRPTIVVGSSYQWQVQNIIYEKGTGVMDPGQSQLITLIANNTGTATWSKTTGPKINLGTWEPQRSSSVGKNWISNIRATTMNEETVAPGQTAGFQFYVQMPTTGQTYQRMNLVAEGQEWLNDAGLTLYLFGNDFNWSIENVQYNAGTGVMNVGSSQTIAVRAKNIGTATWYKNAGFPVRLGTWEPQRSSVVSRNWLSDVRMSALSEETVAPGQTGTFMGTVFMPSVGNKYQRMNLVAEGFKWLPDKGLTFYLEGR